MEQAEVNENSASQTAGAANTLNAASSPAQPREKLLSPHTGMETCPTCGAGSNADHNRMPARRYVYAIGRIEPRFPRPSIEKEFAQAIGRAETLALTDRQATQKILSERQNRYLVRQLCWVFTIEGLETYIL